MHEEFQESVVADFLAEYSAGRTPNPCLRCNEQIKFAAVLDRARALGFDAVCTGHYAQIVEGVHGRELHRAVDPEKDQSYVLAVLNPDQLSGAIFPLGDSLKSQVREEARSRGLLVADKPDSHDICFIPDGDTAGWLRDRLGAQPGEILDAQTKEPLGQHDGTYAFTIGQRRGLDLRTPAEPGVRRYVVEKDLETNTVLVGTAELLGVRTLIGINPRWCGDAPHEKFSCLAQVRAHGDPVPARAWIENDEVMVSLDEAIRGVACGQAVVLYEGTKVVGSATINVTQS
jgi:tRNA-specific 2-thiouridylase